MIKITFPEFIVLKNQFLTFIHCCSAPIGHSPELTLYAEYSMPRKTLLYYIKKAQQMDPKLHCRAFYMLTYFQTILHKPYILSFTIIRISEYRCLEAGFLS